MGFACIAITIVIYSWVFWNSANEQALSELDNTVHVVTQLVADSPNIQKEIEKSARAVAMHFALPGLAGMEPFYMNLSMTSTTWKIM